MSIGPGENTVTVPVPIVDDLIYEPDIEYFTVELEIPRASRDMHVVSGTPNPVPIWIADDDG